MEKQKLEFTTRLTREDAAGVVEALIEGLKEGALTIRKSGQTLHLDVPRVIDLEVEASLHGDKAKFEIELSWRIKPDEAQATPEPTSEPQPEAAPGFASGSVSGPESLPETLAEPEGAAEAVALQKK